MIKHGFAGILIGATCLLSGAALAAEQREDVTVAAARAWLAVVDAGTYDRSWTETAAYFQSVVPQDQWRQAMQGVRRPLGDALSRELKGATYATELPGAPDGEYVVIHFDTSFENKRTAVETVTSMKDPGGTWRVAGYFIK